ncbi:hypothetical protein P12x_004931 [Tundrisphaera lichenicola]|uniref:hypothetical protein n=1 Tax=Tundrisphaera lichenicola TaxID=2029860 RepID=UPI003EB7ECC6
MLHTVATEGWNPGSPLPAIDTMAGLYRTRREAESIAHGRRLLAVSVRFDAGRGMVVSTAPTDSGPDGEWTSPAIVGNSGGVTVLGAIPSSLVRLIGSPSIHLHPGHDALAIPAHSRRDRTRVRCAAG